MQNDIHLLKLSSGMQHASCGMLVFDRLLNFRTPIHTQRHNYAPIISQNFQTKATTLFIMAKLQTILFISAWVLVSWCMFTYIYISDVAIVSLSQCHMLFKLHIYVSMYFILKVWVVRERDSAASWIARALLAIKSPLRLHLAADRIECATEQSSTLNVAIKFTSTILFSTYFWATKATS